MCTYAAAEARGTRHINTFLATAQCTNPHGHGHGHGLDTFVT